MKVLNDDINIPDNIIVENPIHLISLVDNEDDAISKIKNRITVGKNCTVKIIQCEDTVLDKDYNLNTETEIFIDENSSLELYTLFQISNTSTVNNSVVINQKNNSIVKFFSFELNAGSLNNNIITNLDGANAQSFIYGIYLADKQQKIENNVLVNHNAPNCLSKQIFKGIVDDQAFTNFNGMIVVNRVAQKTEASQINRNILLTDKARTISSPLLEIYADDVKCNHGATVGQLDENAMFYLNARGISPEKARMLLLHAFVGEVIAKINVENIAIKINDLVKKRLNGEVSDCSACILKCSDSNVNKGCF